MDTKMCAAFAEIDDILWRFVVTDTEQRRLNAIRAEVDAALPVVIELLPVEALDDDEWDA